MSMMSRDNHAAVSNAIRAAENDTDGEIYAVIARRSDDYFATAAFAVSLAAILGGFVLALALHQYWIAIDAQTYMTAFALAYLAALAVLMFAPSLALRLVPRSTLHKRAHQNAVSQFIARNIHITKARTGVLLFVSVDERYAEVIADDAINSHVSQAEWDLIVAMLIEASSERRYAEGFLQAIAATGTLLAAHFPKTGGDTNELDDHVVEL
jgi:putative membrane protein